MGRIVIAWEPIRGRAWISPMASSPRAPSWYSEGPHATALDAVRAAQADGIRPTHHVEVTEDGRRSPVPVQETTA